MQDCESVTVGCTLQQFHDRCVLRTVRAQVMGEEMLLREHIDYLVAMRLEDEKRVTPFRLRREDIHLKDLWDEPPSPILTSPASRESLIFPSRLVTIR